MCSGRRTVHRRFPRCCQSPRTSTGSARSTNSRGTPTVWGELWHHDGVKREQRNAILRARDTYDYTFTEWIYGPTALTPEEEPDLYPVVPLDSVEVANEAPGLVSAG